MSGQNTAVVTYVIPSGVMRGIEKLRNSECKIELSVVAKEDSETNRGDNVINDSWSRLWWCLPDWARFEIPEIGPLVIAGPMSRLMVSVLHNVSIFDGLNALEACLHSIGVPGERIPACEAAVQAGAILLLVHGTEQEVRKAREVLADARTRHGELRQNPVPPLKPQ